MSVSLNRLDITSNPRRRIAFQRGNPRHELLLCGYRMGRAAAVRALGEELAQRDRELAELRAEFDHDISELRALLNQVREKSFYLQKLDAAMREMPTGILH